MKVKPAHFFFLLILINPFLSAKSTVRLIVRGDDMGSTRASNFACIQAHTAGIITAVEVMSVGPWFREAAQMLEKHQGLDVGVHLAITSEWSTFKWRPLTNCNSLMDEDGYFRPMVWPNSNFPEGSSHSEHDWKLDEIETEVRAQIELAQKYIPQLSHVTTHMGFSSLDDSVESMVRSVAAEYGLAYGGWMGEMTRFEGWGNAETLDDKIHQFVANLGKLEPGTYQYVEHPAYDIPEMQGVSHPGYDRVGQEREHVTRVFISEKVKTAIDQLGIELISFKDVMEDLK